MPNIIPPADEPSSFDAPYGLYLDHATRTAIVTNIVGEPALSAEHIGDFDYWLALATAWPWENTEGYTLDCREWNPSSNDPDQLRGYLPFADEREITS